MNAVTPRDIFFEARSLIGQLEALGFPDLDVTLSVFDLAKVGLICGYADGVLHEQGRLAIESVLFIPFHEKYQVPDWVDWDQWSSERKQDFIDQSDKYLDDLVWYDLEDLACLTLLSDTGYVSKFAEAACSFAEFVVKADGQVTEAEQEKLKYINILVYEVKVERDAMEKRRQGLRDQIFTQGYHEYISNFVSQNRHAELRQSLKLRDLLASKGVPLLSLEDLGWLLVGESKFQEYQRLCNAIPPETTDYNGYVQAFLEHYGDKYKKFTGPFMVLLQKRGIVFEKLFAMDLFDNFKRRLEDIKKAKELARFEESLRDNVRPVSVGDLHSLSGHDFETFLKSLFEKMGFTVEQTKPSSDQGCDLILTKLGEKTVVQAKRYAGTVGNDAVQEVVASLRHYESSKAMVVTTGFFTRSAVELAKSNQVELIDRNTLGTLMSKYL